MEILLSKRDAKPSNLRARYHNRKQMDKLFCTICGVTPGWRQVKIEPIRTYSPPVFLDIRLSLANWAWHAVFTQLAQRHRF
jgi:hypothetical protein